MASMTVFGSFLSSLQGSNNDGQRALSVKVHYCRLAVLAIATLAHV